MEEHSQDKKRSPAVVIGTVGLVIVFLGILAILGTAGYNYIMPILSQPGPTNTMIQGIPQEESNLNQPGILGEIKSFDIEGSNFKFVPNQIVVNQGDTVQINFTSTQGVHNLVIEGLNLQTKTVQAGESDQLTFVAGQKGTYNIYCGIGNHRAMGMVGVLVVN